MERPVIYDRWRRPTDNVREKNNQERMTESAGYVPADVQIRRMTQQGISLAAYRREQFDYAEREEVPDGIIDPTRDSDFDMADASMAMESVKAKKDEKRVDSGTDEAKAKDEKKADEAEEE